MIAEWLSRLTEAEIYFLMILSFVGPMFAIVIGSMGTDRRRVKHIEQHLGISQPPSLLDRIQRVWRRSRS